MPRTLVSWVLVLFETKVLVPTLFEQTLLSSTQKSEKHPQFQIPNEDPEGPDPDAYLAGKLHLCLLIQDFAQNIF